MFSKKATKIDKIFTVDLKLCSKCQIDVEDFFQFLWPSWKTQPLYNIKRYTLTPWLTRLLVLEKSRVNRNPRKPKVIREKSRGEGSLIVQDTIENVSEPKFFF